MIKIYRGTSGFEFVTERGGYHTNYAVQELCSLCKDYVWDRKTQRLALANQFYILNQTNGVGTFPIHLYSAFVSILDSHKIPYRVEDVLPPEPSMKLNLTIKDGYTPKPEQKDAVEYLADPNTNFKCLASQTGAGKTFMSVYAAVQLNEPTICICSGLVEQWVDAWLQYTNIRPEDIYVVRGNSSVVSLLEDDELNPKVIIASLETMRDFTQGKGVYASYPRCFMDLIIAKNIGTKILDEAHLAFHTLVKIDLTANVKQNIYLTATYERNNKSSNRVYERVFPPDIRFGEDQLFKYCKVLAINYSFNVPPKRYMQGPTYSHFKYEKFILTSDQTSKSFLSMLRHYVISQYQKRRMDGDKIIIFFAMRSSIDIVVNYLRYNFDGLRVEPYTQEDPEDHLEADIIVTTLKSAGTGKDIKGLITGINTISFSSAPQCAQMLGRLRYKEGKEMIFVDVHNSSIPPHCIHARNRLDVYNKRALVVEGGRY